MVRNFPRGYDRIPKGKSSLQVLEKKGRCMSGRYEAKQGRASTISFKYSLHNVNDDILRSNALKYIIYECGETKHYGSHLLLKILKKQYMFLITPNISN